MTAFPDDYYTTVAELENYVEGQPHTPPERLHNARHWECDYCSKGWSYTGGSDAIGYLADRIIGDSREANALRKQPRLTTLALYGTDHPWSRKLLFPCEGFTEVRYTAHITEDGHYEDVEITDVSPADDGIPWDPRAVSEAITQVSYDALDAMGDERMGPENTVVWFLAISDECDIRDLVSWDGSLNGKELGRARREYEDFRTQLNAKDPQLSRQAWKETMRERGDR
jgi:hypothetical protein